MEYVVICGAIAVFLLFMAVGGMIEEKKKKERFRQKLYTDYGKPSHKEYPQGRLETIEGYSKRKDGEFSIDDITWNDLDMDRIFKMIDFSYSAAGEEYLYNMLRSPSLKADAFEEMENYISYFMEHEDERVNMQMLFATIGRTGKYSIFDYLDSLDTLEAKGNLKHYLMIAVMVASALVCFVDVGFGVFALFMCLLFNMTSYFKEKNRVAPYITTFSYLLRLLDSVKEFKKQNLAILREDVLAMETSCKKCRKFSKGSYMVTSMNSAFSNPLEVIGDYMKMVFHVDLIKFNLMLEQAKKHKADFIRIFEITGKLEAYISIGAYRKSLNYYALPEFYETSDSMTEGGEVLQAELIYHPLIDKPVANSFRERGSMLLTGSNASGKSTFLKMVAINAILAQSIHTVCAEKYLAKMYRIYTSMSLRDDLAGGDSYFIVEIKALKRILDAMKKEGPLLCFVDEVLRGTNTVERVAASCEILRNLNGRNHTCFAATHDIELTELLQKEYANYHFEETVENNDILFNYKLLKGKAQTRNAIKLLSILGFEKEMIDSAAKRAELFVTKGVWEG